MARKIIVLERNVVENELHLRVAFWLDVHADRRALYANAAAESAVRDGSVTAPELAAIRDGSVHERVVDYRVPRNATVAQIKTHLAGALAGAQAELEADNRYQWYGTSFDGAAWTNVVRAVVRKDPVTVEEPESIERRGVEDERDRAELARKGRRS
jgi:hypothetical protein